MGTGDLVIATDFGTSSVKIGVVGADLKIQERVTVEYPLHVGPNGVAEQNPEDWWRAFRSAMTQLSARIPDLAQRVGALSFCSQACG